MPAFFELDFRRLTPLRLRSQRGPGAVNRSGKSLAGFTRSSPCSPWTPTILPTLSHSLLSAMPSVAHSADNGSRTVRERAMAPATAPILPGSTVTVADATSIYNGYTGFVQRISGDRAAVLFEGGNWDKLVTLRLKDLQPA